MGIPHLITHLRPYAQAESLSGKRICIDGPALAYHVYFICLAARFSSENPFEAMPSYQEIRDTTIAWLYGLEASGATMLVSSYILVTPTLIRGSEKIFFDGYLPATKLNTRLERLRSQTKKLDTYHHANPALCQLPRRRTPINPNLFGRNSVKSSHLSFPPVPFLVPTVLDALLSSGHFGTFTRVVPGEADSFCAAYLNEHGGAVITGDSDLLVYDLGAAGSVVFLRDIEVTENGNPSALQSPIFEVTNIAHRLGLPAVRGIRELAFELRTDSNASLGTLLRRAATGTAAKLYSDKYQRFCQEYEFPTGIFIQETPCGKVVKATQRVLQSLDPRISEYVLQFPSLSSLTELEVAHSDIPHIFLPFLLGSPVLTNAFETSTAVRLLAYSILNLIVPENERCLAVIEHRKQQTDSGGRKWEVPDASLMEESCEALLQLFSAIHSRYPAASHAEFFLAVAIHQVSTIPSYLKESFLCQRSCSPSFAGSSIISSFQHPDRTLVNILYNRTSNGRYLCPSLH